MNHLWGRGSIKLSITVSERGISHGSRVAAGWPGQWSVRVGSKLLSPGYCLSRKPAGMKPMEIGQSGVQAGLPSQKKRARSHSSDLHRPSSTHALTVSIPTHSLVRAVWQRGGHVEELGWDFPSESAFTRLWNLSRVFARFHILPDCT